MSSTHSGFHVEPSFKAEHLHSNAGSHETPELPPSNWQYPILVHSHLRWDWVWQRPQQFLSRLARRHPVLFVEEPLGVHSLGEARATLSASSTVENLWVLRTEMPVELHADRRRLDLEQRRLVRGALAGPLGEKFRHPVQWFYDPMAVSAFAGRMKERAIVYDCMDQLSQFRGAPPELVRREQHLLSLADVVFAGGPKMHRAKAQANANCHCYGCGVDIAHFGQALQAATPVPEELAGLQRPVLGYFGVVDERLDYELIAALADAHPQWSVVIIGPAAKVNPSHFPQRPNLHWLGGREYRDLPGYVKGMDVCLMPFALNEATEFINPTKALEYMSAGRPIVSTAIEDVVLQFEGVVEVAHTHQAFIAACERAVQEANPERIAAGLALAEANSWEAIVEQLEGHIAQALLKRAGTEICAA